MRHLNADGQIERLRVCAILQYHLRGMSPALDQATVPISWSVGRPTLSRQPFLMLAGDETISVWYSKLDLGGSDSLPPLLGILQESMRFLRPWA